MKTPLRAMTNEQLVDHFKELSFRQGEELDNPRQYKSAYEKLKEIGEELRRRGSEARRALLPLLDRPSHHGKFMFVSSIAQCRFNAAWELLAVEPDRAQATLGELAANGPIYQKGLAAGTLQALDDGSLKPI